MTRNIMSVSVGYRHALGKWGLRIGGIALLALLVLYAAWKWSRVVGWWAGEVVKEQLPSTTSPPHDPTTSTPPDPRLTFATPYRNVRPEVGYVGDEACSACHSRIADTYRRHPMGRSLSSVTSLALLERDDAASHNPFDAAGFRYAVERRGERVFHMETALDAAGKVLVEMEAEVQFAIGSGERGRSYLIDRDGYLFASPLSWYPQKGIWDLSPGYAKHNPHFGRPISPDCLFCHANQVEHVEPTANRYRPPLFRGAAIGCERCHGPGELHVRRHQNHEEVAGIDETIVNPRHLEPGLREAVCQQCHLQGEQRILRRGRKHFDYRPGLPAQFFFVDFVKPAPPKGSMKFVGTVEQMYASRCFQESRGPDRLGCISCHDPHKLPAADKKAVYYRARCLSCHREESCHLSRPIRLEKAKDDNCSACHMPRTGSDVNHTAITDHRILRRPEMAAKEPAGTGLPAGQVPLVRFPPRAIAPDDTESGRDLGVALMEWTDKQADRTARQLSDLALPLLESALRSEANDPAAWEAMGSALWFQGRLAEALTAYETALQQSPERETSLFLAATLALRLNRRDAARAYAERALRVNPWRWQYHQMLAAIQVHNEDWPQAIQECQETLKLHQASLTARGLLITSYLRTGQKAKEQMEFNRLLLLSPPQQQEALRHRFEQQLR
jgi:hypothetical protein